MFLTMTGWRRSSSPRPSRTARVRAVWTTTTAAVAAGTSLVAGCGVLPGGSGGSREPVKVMTFAPEDTRATNMPGMPAMAKAYAKWAKTQDGLDGHELRVISCNEENSSTGAAACARRAVKEGVVAVVGSYSQHGDAFMAPGGRGHPLHRRVRDIRRGVHQLPLLPRQRRPGIPSRGQRLQLADVCERVSLVRPNTLAGDELPQLLNSGLSEGSRDKSTDILAAEDATDYTSQATQARKKAGAGITFGSDRPGCVTAALGDRTETFVDSFRRLPEDNRKIRISSVMGSVGQPLIDRTGGRNGPLEGAYVTGWYPDAGDARWTEMEKVIRAHAFGDNRIDPADAGVQTTWIAYTVLRTVIKSLNADKITPGMISKALDNGVQVSTGGLTPTLRWEYDDMLGAPSFPRIVNRSVTFQVVRGGRLVAQKPGFVDVTKTLTESSTL